MKDKFAIYIRADGNSMTGLGHLYRSFAIAEMLKGHLDFSIVTRSNSNIEVIPEEFKVLLIPDEVSIMEEANWLANKLNIFNTVVIADGYHFNSQYQKSIKEAGFKLIYIDDLAKEYMYADIVMNQAPGFSLSDYKAEPYTQFALGLDYVLLRPDFIQSAIKDNKREDNEEDRFFVCYGGSDPLSYTKKTLETILPLVENKIEVVVGAANKDGKELLKMYGHHDQVHFHKSLNQSQMLEVMKKCSVAIVPSSGILIEATAAGCDIITCWYVQNQKRFHDALVSQGIINSFGDNSQEFQKQSLENLIRTLKEGKGIVSSAGLKAQIKFSKKNIIAMVQAL